MRLAASLRNEVGLRQCSVCRSNTSPERVNHRKVNVILGSTWCILLAKAGTMQPKLPFSKGDLTGLRCHPCRKTPLAGGTATLVVL